MRPRRAIALASTLVAAQVHAADEPIPLRPGVVLAYVHHNFDNPRDRQILTEITSVSAEEVRFSTEVPGRQGRFEQTMTRPEMQRSKTISFGHPCADEDWSAAAESLQGSSRFMASQRLFRALREEGEGELASYYVTGCSLPRLISGPVKKVGIETLPILFEDGARTVSALHLQGRMTKVLEHIDWTFEWWFLDDPERPWLLGVTGTEAGTKNTYRMQMTMVLGRFGAEPGPWIEQALASQCEATIYGVTFATGSAELSSISRRTLDEVATVLRKHPDWKLTIEGHTDDIGSKESNQLLSDRRAAAVREALVKDRGIPAAALDSKGFGLTRPVATNATIEGRAKNRRVTLARGCRR